MPAYITLITPDLTSFFSLGNKRDGGKNSTNHSLTKHDQVDFLINDFFTHTEIFLVSSDSATVSQSFQFFATSPQVCYLIPSKSQVTYQCLLVNWREITSFQHVYYLWFSILCLLTPATFTYRLGEWSENQHIHFTRTRIAMGFGSIHMSESICQVFPSTCHLSVDAYTKLIQYICSTLTNFNLPAMDSGLLDILSLLLFELSGHVRHFL